MAISVLKKNTNARLLETISEDIEIQILDLKKTGLPNKIEECNLRETQFRNRHHHKSIKGVQMN